MDYARFVQLRRPVWDRFERELQAMRDGRAEVTYAEVEELALRYRQILHDHAWARARFAGTGAAQLLQRLAVEGGTLLQRDETERRTVLDFFFVRVPAAIRAEARWIGVAVALFLVATLLGLGVAIYEPGVAVGLLGPSAVRGLRDGHLWTETLTSTLPPAFSSSRIATNNMSVALTAWAGGALAGIGALWVVLLNGFMLGAAFGVTARYSMEADLGAFVLAHGLLEITLILVSAGAGLAVGAALLRADDLPRSVTVPRAAREAMVVLLGCLPWFLVLGLVEGFVSPSPALAWHWKALLGVALEICFLTPILAGVLERPARGKVA